MIQTQLRFVWFNDRALAPERGQGSVIKLSESWKQVVKELLTASHQRIADFGYLSL